MSESAAPQTRAFVPAWAWSTPENADVFGFSTTRSGALMSRSIMLRELAMLVAETPPQATLADIRAAVLDENLLGKVTWSSRLNSLRHLRELYTLNNSLSLFRLLRLMYQEDPASLPQLALVCAFCRDIQLRESFRLIESLHPGELLPRARMEAHLEATFPGRYSDKMKVCLAKHANTSWRDSGHLQGRNRKSRTLPKATLGGVTLAMLAGYLLGLRGYLLLDSVLGRLVSGDSSQLLAMLHTASGRGWCRVRHAGGVLDIDFTALLTPTERELLHGAA